MKTRSMMDNKKDKITNGNNNNKYQYWKIIIKTRPIMGNNNESKINNNNNQKNKINNGK